MTKTGAPEDVQLAKLADGEVLISKEMADKYRKNIEAQKAKQKEGIIGSPVSAGGNKVPSLKTQEKTDVIGTNGRAQKPSAKAGQKKPTVAIYSDRNVSWIGVGKISKGYNIVTKEQSEKWLTRKHVREATPEEVASEFGV
jgi:hypothetical protein